MRESIVEFTAIDTSNAKSSEDRSLQVQEAIERLKRDLYYILTEFEGRINALEDK